MILSLSITAIGPRMFLTQIRVGKGKVERVTKSFVVIFSGSFTSIYVSIYLLI